MRELNSKTTKISSNSKSLILLSYFDELSRFGIEKQTTNLVDSEESPFSLTVTTEREDTSFLMHMKVHVNLY